MTRIISAIALLTCKEGLKQRIVYGVIVFSLLAISLIVLLSGYFLRDISKILIELSLSVVSITGLVVPFFITISLLSGDFERRSAYTILAGPVSRGQYILGKYLGLSIICLVVVSITTLFVLAGIYLATFLYPAHFFSTLSYGKILLAAGMQFIGLLLLNSLVVLWCCSTTSPFLATLLCLASYIIGHTSENMVRFMLTSQEGMQISPLVKKVVQSAMYIFPNLSTFDLKKMAAYNLAVTSSEILFSMSYAASYITVVLIVSILIFNRRNLP